jgi:hypothetical protein
MGKHSWRVFVLPYFVCARFWRVSFAPVDWIPRSAKAKRIASPGPSAPTVVKK